MSIWNVYQVGAWDAGEGRIRSSPLGLGVGGETHP